MKIAVQHKQTKRFLIEPEIWTDDPDEAREFPTAVNACFFSVHNGLLQVDIVQVSREQDRDCRYVVQVCA